jgi:hypothetical protein
VHQVRLPCRYRASVSSASAEQANRTPRSRPDVVQIDTVRVSSCQDRHLSSYGWAPSTRNVTGLDSAFTRRFDLHTDEPNVGLCHHTGTKHRYTQGKDRYPQPPRTPGLHAEIPVWPVRRDILACEKSCGRPARNSASLTSKPATCTCSCTTRLRPPRPASPAPTKASPPAGYGRNSLATSARTCGRTLLVPSYVAASCGGAPLAIIKG